MAPRVPLDTTEVITTIRLVGDPDFNVAEMTDVFGVSAYLIQSDDGNFGIVGTRERIDKMITRIQSAMAAQEVSKTA